MNVFSKTIPHNPALHGFLKYVGSIADDGSVKQHMIVMTNIIFRGLRLRSQASCTSFSTSLQGLTSYSDLFF